ncbi:hypothetical protein HYFRA_00002984 [Hymenoscyphus fraxineus]|uniref:Uncharacterized protein n=1 Tax=Hymenoscyphus fraxineus TaxID=746836 RepID=A0A9N9KP67_9HELO|nr:hypothetical protein HYFRA_00002984 [Hymenoscyphus fraxineus]
MTDFHETNPTFPAQSLNTPRPSATSFVKLTCITRLRNIFKCNYNTSKLVGKRSLQISESSDSEPESHYNTIRDMNAMSLISGSFGDKNRAERLEVRNGVSLDEELVAELPSEPSTDLSVGPVELPAEPLRPKKREPRIGPPHQNPLDMNHYTPFPAVTPGIFLIPELPAEEPRIRRSDSELSLSSRVRARTGRDVERAVAIAMRNRRFEVTD